MDPTITASLVSAAATIVSAIVNATQQAVSQTEGTRVGIVVENQTSTDFTIRSFEPMHGHWREAPSGRVTGSAYLQSEFMKAAREQFGDNPSLDQLNQLIGVWQSTNRITPDTFPMACAGVGVGDGMGFEALFSLQAADSNTIGLLFRKIPGGSFGVGFSLSNEGWWNPNTAESDGSGLIGHIKSVHTELSQFSDGGAGLSGQIGSVKVTVSAPGEVIRVTLSN